MVGAHTIMQDKCPAYPNLCITARLLCVIKKLSCTQQTTITQQISTCNRLKKHIFPKHLFKHQSRSRMELGSSKPHWLDNLIKHSTHIIELRIPLKITIKLIFVTKKLDFCTFTHACSCSMSQKKKSIEAGGNYICCRASLLSCINSENR